MWFEVKFFRQDSLLLFLHFEVNNLADALTIFLASDPELQHLRVVRLIAKLWVRLLDDELVFLIDESGDVVHTSRRQPVLRPLLQSLILITSNLLETVEEVIQLSVRHSELLEVERHTLGEDVIADIEGQLLDKAGAFSIANSIKHVDSVLGVPHIDTNRVRRRLSVAVYSRIQVAEEELV